MIMNGPGILQAFYLFMIQMNFYSISSSILRIRLTNPPSLASPEKLGILLPQNGVWAGSVCSCRNGPGYMWESHLVFLYRVLMLLPLPINGFTTWYLYYLIDMLPAHFGCHLPMDIWLFRTIKWCKMLIAPYLLPLWGPHIHSYFLSKIPACVSSIWPIPAFSTLNLWFLSHYIGPNSGYSTFAFFYLRCW